MKQTQEKSRWSTGGITDLQQERFDSKVVVFQVLETVTVRLTPTLGEVTGAGTSRQTVDSTLFEGEL